MSRSRNRNSLLSSHNRTSYSTSTKDELLEMKFHMDKPEVPIYPLNASDTPDSFDSTKTYPTFPDFDPWNDHTHGSTQQKSVESDRLTNPVYLNKGYFESPHVANEYYSLRPLLQLTMFSSLAMCNSVLKELSQHLTNAYNTRNEVINKIHAHLNHFRPPHRVTLTALKKEAWLRDLANPDVPLHKLSNKLPHGIRNKVLVDTLCSKNVPLTRAVWFTRCTLYGELLVIRRKSHSDHALLEAQWTQEWTQQVLDYIYKFSRELAHVMTQEKEQACTTKLNYLLAYVLLLYLEGLFDKHYFLQTIIKSLQDGIPFDNLTESEPSLNYGVILVSLTLVTMFWNDIIQFDYHCKELSELLLLNYYFIEKLSTHHKKSKSQLSPRLKQRLLLLISNAIITLFTHNRNAFIIPNYWSIINKVLYKIVTSQHQDESELNNHIHSQLEVINYRNESLMLNMRPSKHDFSSLNRSPDDALRIIAQLDRLQLHKEMANLLKPTSPSWSVKLKLVVAWCSVRNSSEGILIVCNFLKRKVLQSLSLNRPSVKAQFESEILDTIFTIEQPKNPHGLFVLINELYQLKMLTISSYLRKLIALGIFYASEPSEERNRQIDFHIHILQNLPVLNNRQCDTILHKWAEKTDFKSLFEEGKVVLQQNLIDPVISNSLNSDSLDIIDSVTPQNIGLRFLLVNWVTTTLKLSVFSSPKLVHMTPEIIANLYDFYRRYDNLTVFFKVLVKFVLKNEGRIIIFYLDSLYLLAKLIVNHFHLVKFIAGNNNESATEYDLFRLVILNYKDLRTRDADYFRFSEIWAFIDTIVEKTPSFSETESFNMNKVLFKTHHVDSPMRINTFENPKGEKYSSDDFKADLESLLDTTPKTLLDRELSDCVDRLALPGLDLKNLLGSVSVMLKQLAIVELNKDTETDFLKLIVTAQRQTSESSFLHILEQFITTNPDSLGCLLKRLLSYEVIRLPQLVSLLQKLQLQELVSEVLYGPSRGLKNYELLLFDGVKKHYNRKHSEQAFSIAVKSLNADSVQSTDFFSEKLLTIDQYLKKNSNIAIDELKTTLSKNDIIALCNELLGSGYIESQADLVKLIQITDEFNLPIVQLLLTALIPEDLSDEEAEALTQSILDNMTFQFSSSNSYFGELFNFLSWKTKAQFFHTLEDFFLRGTEFTFFSDKQEPHDISEIVVLKRAGSSVNLLPVLKDYFKKFSVSSIENVPSSHKFFQDISKFVLKLVHTVNSDTSLEDSNQNLYDTISIFLRILIIHKMSLTALIIKYDGEQFTFIKNLVILLESRYLLHSNDKLKILLYDLLLLMKSSLTTELTSQENIRNGEDLAVSPAHNNDTSPGTGEPESMEAPGLQTINKVFNLFELNTSDNLNGKLNDNLIDSAITLDEDELNRDSDINYINSGQFVLKSARSNLETFLSDFALLGNNHQLQAALQAREEEFSLKSFQLLEDTSSSINDGCINLLMFDAYTTRENPP